MVGYSNVTLLDFGAMEDRTERIFLKNNGQFFLELPLLFYSVMGLTYRFPMDMAQYRYGVSSCV